MEIKCLPFYLYLIDEHIIEGPSSDANKTVWLDDSRVLIQNQEFYCS